eukprot:TRINITY_DN2087_c0_g1_i1.p1 TRINITY_DN2087_c0_g1~~TRINITY_DN2087_c0_g1_i1.p1  ORF type:complete len:384 (+),score=70.64 TRINITY_DN2087_c0_g1_i1:88-1239(+)
MRVLFVLLVCQLLDDAAALQVLSNSAPEQNASSHSSDDMFPLDAARQLLQSVSRTKGPDLKFVSLNTEGGLALKQVGNFPEDVANVGENADWVGYGTKLTKWLYYTNTLPDDTLLVFVDGNDVVWGGCSKNTFLGAYSDIVRDSGAKIVLGAELVCGEQSCDNSTALPEWAMNRAGVVLKEGSAAAAADDFTECEAQVKPECRCDMPSQPSCRNFAYTGVDDDDWNAAHMSLLSSSNKREHEARSARGPLFRYMNSGFVMGPVKDIRAMLEWAVFHYLEIKKDRTWMHDQGALAAYWTQNPSLVTLDYRGELSLQLPRLSVDVLELKDSWASGKKVVANKLLGGTTQCLVHNNINEWNGGDRVNYWWDFMKQVTADQRDWDAA